jgi:hypothetical protein
MKLTLVEILILVALTTVILTVLGVLFIGSHFIMKYW